MAGAVGSAVAGVAGEGAGNADVKEILVKEGMTGGAGDRVWGDEVVISKHGGEGHEKEEGLVDANEQTHMHTHMHSVNKEGRRPGRYTAKAADAFLVLKHTYV